MTHNFSSMQRIIAPIALDEKAARLDALLPQHQCGRCEYVDCAHYAQALAQGKAAVVSCTPGGEEVAQKLAATINIPLPEDAAFEQETQQCVVIDEAECIGCTRCLRACPLDALIGARKKMHVVLPALCSGCGLCLPVCPVDCMKLVSTARNWTQQDADAARERYQARQRRLLKQEVQRALPNHEQSETEKRRQAATEALAKARARRLQWATQQEERKTS